MYALEANNVNEAFAHGVQYLLDNGVEEPSRNGPVLVAPGPVCTTYLNPAQHVLFSPTRDANPFFHFMEALWMLAGRNDVATVSAFNSRMGEYSDDKKTFHAAYGYRWRNHFGYDQLDSVVDELRRDPASRRAVLAVWDGGQSWYCDDCGAHDDPDGGDIAAALSDGLDIPCNTQAHFDLRGGALNMTVCCRSNDVIWGCYGANAVHWSMLLMYMAARLRAPIGVYRQVSNNFHLYTDKFSRAKLDLMIAESVKLAARSSPFVQSWNTRSATEDWDYRLKGDLNYLMATIKQWLAGHEIEDSAVLQTFWVAYIAAPMLNAWMLYKDKRISEAVAATGDIAALDWELACREWLERRLNR
jgi:thymidylate synthase